VLSQVVGDLAPKEKLNSAGPVVCC